MFSTRRMCKEMRNGMKHLMTLSGVLLLCVLFASLAAADIITINGDDDDWGWLSPQNDDPNEPTIPDYYDINYNWYHWGENAQNEKQYFFMMQQYSAYPTGSNKHSADFAVLMINVDPGKGTGGSPYGGHTGVDYFALFGFETASEMYSIYDAPYYYWDSASSTFLLGGGGGHPNPGVPVAYGNNVNDASGAGYWVIEWQWRPEIFGGPQDVWWAGYLDNGYQPDEDSCPDEGWNRASVPVPGTLVLFASGLLGAAVARLRQKREKD